MRELTADLRARIVTQVEGFLWGPAHRNTAIISLNELSNTKATLLVTELYLSTILNLARDRRADFPRVLLAIEEAHTAMPEPNTMGLGDFDSKALVGKIAQVALQGRKYGVGLLIVAQRTATVSKSVLTQCNTIISLPCFDGTSLEFLENFYGTAYRRAIPNLPPYHALIFGKAVRSQRPIMVQIQAPAAQAMPDGTAMPDAEVST